MHMWRISEVRRWIIQLFCTNSGPLCHMLPAPARTVPCKLHAVQGQSLFLFSWMEKSLSVRRFHDE